VAFVLLDQHPLPIKAVLQRTVRADVKLTGDDAPAIAAGMRAAIAEVLEKIEQDLARVVR
jgi:hypothetical protein